MQMAEQWAVEVDVKKMLHSSSSGQAYYFIFIVFVFCGWLFIIVILFKKYFLDGVNTQPPWKMSKNQSMDKSYNTARKISIN